MAANYEEKTETLSNIIFNLACTVVASRQSLDRAYANGMIIDSWGWTINKEQHQTGIETLNEVVRQFYEDTVYKGQVLDKDAREALEYPSNAWYERPVQYVVADCKDTLGYNAIVGTEEDLKNM